MEIQTEQFTAAVKRELQNSHSRAFLKLMPPVLNMKRDIGLSTFPDIDAAQAYGSAIRQEAMARLPELLEEFEKNALANGAKVFWARDAKEANAYILHLAKEREIEYVTKGKSMVTEETGLNEVLHKNGV
jgi:L-lactate dehydrogenase complex protein LldF